MNRSIDAYAAGLIDGEGCIYVGTKGRAFWPQVDTGMTKKALQMLEMLRAEYGGTLKLMRPATDRWEEAWTWTLYGQVAVAALERWLPHLHLKQEQARLAIKVAGIRSELEHWPSGKRAYWTDEAVERCRKIRARMMELNAKGPSPTKENVPPGAKLIALHVAGGFVSLQHSMFDDLQWAPFSDPWPKAGLVTSSGVYSMPDTSESPNDAVACSLSQVLEPTVSEKYYLSPRAAAGILRRAERRGKELPETLRTALESLASQSPTSATAQFTPSVAEGSAPSAPSDRATAD